MTGSRDRQAARCVIMLVLATGMAAVSAQSTPVFSELTVPAASLPAGCRLTPSSPEPTPIPQPEGTVAAIAPKPFALRSFPRNPWFGSDYKYIAQVRQAIERAPAIQFPDGPPLEPKEAARLAWTLKGNIVEAYRASYETAASVSILVQAVRYSESRWATPGQGRIVRGSAVIVVTGNPQSECFKAIQNYIQSLK